MKKFSFYILAILMVAVSCSKENFNANPDMRRKTVTSTYVFESSVANVEDTRTSLGTNDQVFWSVGDKISVFDRNGLRGVSAPLAEADINQENPNYATFTVTFNGADAAVPPFYAIYGLADVVRNTNGVFEADIPAYQTYRANGFSDNENPSYAECTAVDSEGKGFFQFENLCGILNVRIPKTHLNNLDKVAYAQIFNRGEAFTGIQSQGYLSGRFQIINPQTQEQAQTGISGVEYKKILSRNLGAPDGGGMRNKAIRGTISPLTDGSYSFNFIAPVGSFSNGFKIVVAGTNGEFFQKTYKGTDCAVERGIIKQIVIPVDFSPISDVPSAVNSANCFIVPATQGLYEIPVGFKGNGAQGNVTTGDVTENYSKGTSAFGAGSYPISSDGNYSAEVIWQTKNNNERVTEAEIISMDSFIPASGTKGPAIRFYRTGAEGNALVALTKGTGENKVIVWSWHLWVTKTAESSMEFTLGDTPNQYVVMDRNLGAQINEPFATTTQLASDVILSYGQQYQYGRKDPFGGANMNIIVSEGEAYNHYAITYPADAIVVHTSKISTEESILKPNFIVSSDTGWNDEGNFGWASANNGGKTLWDPCPYGWRVMDGKILLSEKDGTKQFNYGGTYVSGTPCYVQFKNANDQTLYFPAAGKGEVNLLRAVGSTFYMWLLSTNEHQALCIQCSPSSPGYKITTPYYNNDHSLPVRCVKWNEPTVNSSTQGSTTTGN